MAKTPRPRTEADPFLVAVSAARDCVGYVVKSATWQLTFASALAFLSRIVPLPTDDITARSLLTLFAVNFGAVLGKPLDRRSTTAARIPFPAPAGRRSPLASP
jgi:hypothetical protein